MASLYYQASPHTHTHCVSAGGINVAAPLTLGDGSFQLSEVIKQGSKIGLRQIFPQVDQDESNAPIFLKSEGRKVVCYSLGEGHFPVSRLPVLGDGWCRAS